MLPAVLDRATRPGSAAPCRRRGGSRRPAVRAWWSCGAGLLLAGCGAASPDLFEVRRSGEDRNANVTLVVSDGGSVRCNDGEPLAIDAEQLLEARSLARDIERQAALAIELPEGEDPTLSYRVRMEAGEVAFTDRSPGRPQTFNRVVAFTADVVENVCGIER